MNAAIVRFLGVLSILIGWAAALAATPVGWRADGNGVYPDAKPPTEWNDEKNETKNIVWKTKLPGHSYGSPIVVGDRVFVVSDPAELSCVQARDGEIAWTRSHPIEALLGEETGKKVAAEFQRFEDERRRLERERNQAKDDNEKKEALKKQLEAVEQERKELAKKYPAPPRRGGGGNTAATPVCDGRQVYVVFANGLVAAYSLDGERRWLKFIPPAEMGFGQSSSPVVLDGKLFVHLDGLIALDAKTGEEQWRVPLSSNHASPIALKVGDTPAVLSPTGNLVRVRDGKILLKHNGIASSESTPIHHNGIVYTLHGKVQAWRLVPDGPDAVKAEKVWEAKLAGGRRLPSAVLHQGLLYSITTEGLFDVIDATTGEPLYTQRSNLGQVYTSATAAGNHIYLGSTKGTTLVLANGREFREVARNKVEGFGTCPVFVGERMFLRTNQHLYCIGK